MKKIYMHLTSLEPGKSFLNGEVVRHDSDWGEQKVFQYGFYFLHHREAYREPGFRCEMRVKGEIRFDYLRKHWSKTLVYEYVNLEEEFFSEYVRAEYAGAWKKKRLVTTRRFSTKKGETVFFKNFIHWPFELLFTDSERKRAARYESRMYNIAPRIIGKYKRLDEKEYKEYRETIKVA